MSTPGWVPSSSLQKYGGRVSAAYPSEDLQWDSTEKYASYASSRRSRIRLNFRTCSSVILTLPPVRGRGCLSGTGRTCPPLRRGGHQGRVSMLFLPPVCLVPALRLSRTRANGRTWGDAACPVRVTCALRMPLAPARSTACSHSFFSASFFSRRTNRL